MTVKRETYSVIFFGGTNNVRTKLAAAVLGRLKEETGDFERIDSLCGFGRGKSALPTCREVQADNQRLRCSFFSRAAYPLRLTLDEVLPLDPAKLTPALLSQVKEEMMSKGAGAVSGYPGPSAEQQELREVSQRENTPPSDEEATIYIWLKIADEVDRNDSVVTTTVAAS